MKTTNELAHELEVPLDELNQVAALGKSSYFYKRSRKGARLRTLRCPKERLLRIQTAIMRKILLQLSLPATMHGWRPGHSPRTYAAKHVGRKVVLNIDIKDFFLNVRAGRVHAFWASLGYEPAAARLLTLLTTCDNQLPQGAPTSPLLGNQILRKLDHRLSFVARHGLNYGSYADEFSISGRPRAEHFRGLVVKIAKQEGLKVNPEKVKIMHDHQRQEIAGIVLNKKPSLGREKYRNLRAIIHNCIVHGSARENRQGHPKFRAHLRGRIAYLQSISPKLGRRLLRELEKVQWSASE